MVVDAYQGKAARDFYDPGIVVYKVTCFARPRIRRRIASVMLLFWLFALGSAWANACLLQDRATHPDASIVDRVSIPALSPGHAVMAAGQAGDPFAGESPCLKVCDEVKQTTVKWQSDDGLNTIGMVSTAAMAWAASDAATGAWRHAPWADVAMASRPLRTLYMRLAL